MNVEHRTDRNLEDHKPRKIEVANVKKGHGRIRQRWDPTEREDFSRTGRELNVYTTTKQSGHNVNEDKDIGGVLRQVI